MCVEELKLVIMFYQSGGSKYVIWIIEIYREGIVLRITSVFPSGLNVYDLS